LSIGDTVSRQCKEEQQFVNVLSRINHVFANQGIRAIIELKYDTSVKYSHKVFYQ